MRLELATFEVKQVEFASKTALSNRLLTIDKDELISLLSEDDAIDRVEIELARPGERCRIINVFDVVEPRAKADQHGLNFPGVLDEMGTAGQGQTLALKGVTIVTVDQMNDGAKTIIDMSGPCVDLSSYSSTYNVVLLCQPADGVGMAEYYRALTTAFLKTSVYLAQVARDTQPDDTVVYDLEPPASASANEEYLPRIAYIFPVRSQQKTTEDNEPILYGDNVRGLLPTVLHPNEVLDGAVLGGYWSLGNETFVIQNHPVVKGLFREHGLRLRFAGVVAVVAHPTVEARERSVRMAANIVKFNLGADGVIITKTGGGMPETDLMMLCDACEQLGVKTTLIVWERLAEGSAEGALTVFSPRADAMVSIGDREGRILLPAVDRVIGGEWIAQYIERPDDIVRASGEINLSVRMIAGALSQLGTSRLTTREY